MGIKHEGLIIGVAMIFDWGGPSHKSHVMTSSETLNKEFFVGANDIVKWKIRSRGLVLARNFKGEDLKGEGEDLTPSRERT